MNKIELTKKLNEILVHNKDEEGIVLSLNGEWGIGKTVFWKNYAHENLISGDDKKVAYISLFGKDSLESINTEILLKVSDNAKKISLIKDLKERYGNALKTINDLSYGIGGVLSSAIISTLNNNFFEGKIICFDDFERISNKLSHKDVMGLVSSLKEDKKCKIIIIMHQDKIEQNTTKKLVYSMDTTLIDQEKNLNLNFVNQKNSQFDEYKEKLVDIELFYSPLIEEVFSLVEYTLIEKDFKNYLLRYLEDKNIKNIRVIKRVIRALNDFIFIKDWESLTKRIEQEIIENLMEVSTIYGFYHFSDFSDLSKYSIHQRTSRMLDTEEKYNQKYEEMLEYIYYDYEYQISGITEVVIEYIKTNVIDINKLKYIANEKYQDETRNTLYDEVKNLNDDYTFNMNFSNDDYAIKMYTLLDNNKRDIMKVVGPSNFIFYINQLKGIDKADTHKQVQYDKLLEKAAKFYIYNYFIQEDREYKTYYASEFALIKDEIESVGKFADKIYSRIIRRKTSNLDDIKMSLERIVELKYNNHDIDMLVDISNNDYKKYILSDKNFSELAFKFLRKRPSKDAYKIGEKINKAFIELKDEKPDLESKIDRLLKLISAK